jgi:hypothetical protein
MLLTSATACPLKIPLIWILMGFSIVKVHILESEGNNEPLTHWHHHEHLKTCTTPLIA